MTVRSGVHFDTADFAAGEREAAVQDVMGHGTVPLEIEHLRRRQGQRVGLQFSSADFGPLAVQTLRCSATAFRRTSHMLGDSSPATVSLTVQRTGSSTVIQDDREAVAGAGDLVLTSSAWPSLVRAGHDSSARVVQLPARLLAMPGATLRRVVAVRVTAQNPVGGVLGRYVDDLATLPALPPADTERFAQPTVELVRALVATMVGDSRGGRDPLDGTLQLRLRDYLEAHWSEPDLTADRIAAHHHISTRHLYRLLAAEGIVLGAWLRHRRLEACRRELAGPAAAAATVASVGRRWGFGDATNFGRAFKAAYGLTPLEWRSLHGQAARRGTAVPA